MWENKRPASPQARFWVIILQALLAQMVLLSKEDDTCSPGVVRDRVSLCEFILRAVWPSAVHAWGDKVRWQHGTKTCKEERGGKDAEVDHLAASC